MSHRWLTLANIVDEWALGRNSKDFGQNIGSRRDLCAPQESNFLLFNTLLRAALCQKMVTNSAEMWLPKPSKVSALRVTTKWGCHGYSVKIKDMHACRFQTG